MRPERAADKHAAFSVPSACDCRRCARGVPCFMFFRQRAAAVREFTRLIWSPAQSRMAIAGLRMRRAPRCREVRPSAARFVLLRVARLPRLSLPRESRCPLVCRPPASRPSPLAVLPAFCLTRRRAHRPPCSVESPRRRDARRQAGGRGGEIVTSSLCPGIGAVQCYWRGASHMLLEVVVSVKKRPKPSREGRPCHAGRSSAPQRIPVERRAGARAAMLSGDVMEEPVARVRIATMRVLRFAAPFAFSRDRALHMPGLQHTRVFHALASGDTTPGVGAAEAGD